MDIVLLLIMRETGLFRDVVTKRKECVTQSKAGLKQNPYLCTDLTN
jgi:hypothetical protein